MTSSAVLDAIDALYAAALEPERWPEALDKIAHAVGGVGTVIVPVTSPRHTDIQASWTEQERGEEGKFTIQLILDNGAEEYILQPDADDVEPMLRLFALSDHATFDLERKVLMFSNLKTK